MSKKSKFYVRPDGLHEAIRTIGGRRVAFRGRTDREVERKMLAYREEIRQGRLFKDVAKDFHEAHFPTLAPNTLRGYNAAWRRAVETFGERPIRSITTPEISAFVADFAGRGMAKKTVTTQKQMMHMICRWAVEHGDLDHNPAIEISTPKNLKVTHREPASAEDEAAICAHVDLWLLPFFILYTGLRKGEALAIQGADINRHAGTISVSKSLYYQDGHSRLKSPKTARGVRQVPILAPLAVVLPRIAPGDFLFSADGGKSPLSETQYMALWARYQKETGITCTAHQLRHSYAVLLLDADLALKDRQELLGHATAAMTEDTYTHILAGRRAAYAAKINAKIAEASQAPASKK